jgi:glutathione synthase/RimK-type ligase-like ATP-grasp enzyme
MVKNFIFAGLDFLIDKEGGPVFIEANSAPGGLRTYEKLYGNCKPLEELCNFIKERFEKPIVAILNVKTKKNLKHILWKYEKMKIYLKNSAKSVNVCFYQDNDFSNFEGVLIDKDHKKIRPDVVLVGTGIFEPAIEKYCFAINPISVRHLTGDKFSTYKIIKNSGIRTPQTYLVKNFEELKKLTKLKVFEKGFVLKPRYGGFGKDIFVCSRKIDINRFKRLVSTKKFLLQEKIEINKIDGKFWDVRVFIVNGKFVGGIKRVSKKPVVNLSKGGVGAKLNEEIIQKVKNISVNCVKIIDKASQKMNLGRLANQ